MNPAIKQKLTSAYAIVCEQQENPQRVASIPQAVELIDEAMGLIEHEPVEGQPISPGPQLTIPQGEPETLDEKAEIAMSELRRVARQIQELGKEVCDNDYSDGVNLGQGILDWVGACGKLANKFDEVGLCQDKESFFL